MAERLPALGSYLHPRHGARTGVLVEVDLVATSVPEAVRILRISAIVRNIKAHSANVTQDRSAGLKPMLLQVMELGAWAVRNELMQQRMARRLKLFFRLELHLFSGRGKVKQVRVGMVVAFVLIVQRSRSIVIVHYRAVE